MRRSYAVMMFATFVIALVAAVGPFAAAQYASGLPVPIPTSMGGTGVTSLQSGISGGSLLGVASSPCQYAVAYWNADYGISLTDAGTTVYSWTDLCNGYVVTQAVNASAPTYTANCNGTTHHCLTYTVGGTQALTAVGSGAFPAVSLPWTFGATSSSTATAPAQNAFLVDFGTTANKVALYEGPASHMTCLNSGGNSPTVVGTLGSGDGVELPGTRLCLLSPESVTAGQWTASIVAYRNGAPGAIFGTVTSSPNSPTGGITVGNQYNGASSTGSFAGQIFSVVVVSHLMTPIEQASFASYESTFLGGI